jgi:hypothetical protein
VGAGDGSGEAGGEGEGDGKPVGEADDDVAHGLGGLEMTLDVGLALGGHADFVGEVMHCGSVSQEEGVRAGEVGSEGGDSANGK